MPNTKRKIAALLLAASLTPFAVACDDGPSNENEIEDEGGADAPPGSVETPRSEEE